MEAKICTVNTILYCRKWATTVAFYRNILGLEPLMTSDWFVEFSLGGTSRLSVADEARASVKSAAGRGITLGLEVDDLDGIHHSLSMAGTTPAPIRTHPWNARVFYLFDPEGHRIEFWQKS